MSLPHLGNDPIPAGPDSRKKGPLSTYLSPEAETRPRDLFAKGRPHTLFCSNCMNSEHRWSVPTSNIIIPTKDHYHSLSSPPFSHFTSLAMNTQMDVSVVGEFWPKASDTFHVPVRVHNSAQAPVDRRRERSGPPTNGRIEVIHK